MAETKLTQGARIALILLTIYVLLSQAGCFMLGRRSAKQPDPEVKHDTTFVTRTIHDTVEVVKWKDKVRTDTLRLPVVKDSLIAAQDSIVPTVADSATVAVPISQVTCKGENYTAVIEGFRPRLVSIDILQQTQYIETTKTIPPKKWSIGFAAGASAGFYYTPKGWLPGAGVGATIGITHYF